MIPASTLDAWRMHRVGAGETLATIGKRYGVTPANIVSANRLESAQAVEGDRLLDSVRPARPGARGEEDDFGIGTPPPNGPR